MKFGFVFPQNNPTVERLQYVKHLGIRWGMVRSVMPAGFLAIGNVMMTVSGQVFYKVPANPHDTIQHGQFNMCNL